MTSFVRSIGRFGGIAAASAAVTYAGSRYYDNSFLLSTQAHAESIPSDAKASLNKVPWKGFTELKLESSEMVNHNVKRLTFALPDEQSITGLSPISMWSQRQYDAQLTPISFTFDTAHAGRCMDTSFPALHASHAQW
jgi:hypothetical protein